MMPTPENRGKKRIQSQSNAHGQAMEMK